MPINIYPYVTERKHPVSSIELHFHHIVVTEQTDVPFIQGIWKGKGGTSVVIAIINLLCKTYEGELPPSDNTSWCCWMGLNFGLSSVCFFFPQIVQEMPESFLPRHLAFLSVVAQGCSCLPREKYPGLRDADPATSSKCDDIFKNSKAKPQAFWAKPTEWQGFARITVLEEDLRGTIQTWLFLLTQRM